MLVKVSPPPHPLECRRLGFESLSSDKMFLFACGRLGFISRLSDLKIGTTVVSLPDA